MKLKIISFILKVCLRLLIAFTLFFAVFSTTHVFSSSTTFSNVGIPLLKFKPIDFDDENLESRINENLPQLPPVKIVVDDLGMKIPYSSTFEILRIICLVFIGAYSCLILKIILNIVEDIRKNIIFHAKNISRFKNLALLFIFGPILEGILRLGLAAYIGNLYELPAGITYRAGTDFNFSIFIIGLLSYAVAMAFEQGLVLKEENDLTI